MSISDSPQVVNFNSMIFKTWLTDLTKIQGVVNNIKNVSALANGETRLLNPNVVNSLSSAINGLNIQQAQLALSTKNLTKEQMNQVLVQAGLIASENQIQAELVQSALVQSGISIEKQRSILKELELIDVTTGEILVTKSCTKEKLLNTLAIKGVTGANAEAIVSTLGLTSADEAQIVSKKLLTKAIREQTKAKIANTAASHPMLIGITAIVAATYAAIKASDAWLNKTKNTAIKSTEAYNDLKSQADELNSELQSNCDRIDELNSKEHLTLIESEELQKLKESNRELENQIALKEKLAENELKEARENTLQYFSEGGGWVGNKETHDFEWADRIDFAKNQVEELKNVQNKITEVEKEIALIDTSTVKGKSLYKQKNDELDTLQKSYDIFFEKVQDFNDTFTSLDDNLIEGEDDEIINRLNEFYNLLNETVTGVAQTHTDTIKSILAKADFQDASKQLEELGKNGELSITTLSSRFPELIQYLENAGISAQELYQYIMALSNPDAVNYNNVRKQLMDSIGLANGVNNATDAQLWNQFSQLGTDKVVLDAYLQIVDQYGSHPEGWDAKDWLSNIQAEINSKKLEVEAELETSLSISQTIDQLNTQLKPAMDSIKSAWQDIFTEDGFALNDIDIISTCESIRSELDEMSELGLEIDYSAFDDFVRVLSNTESKEEDVEKTFDELATSITNAGLNGTEDFEVMKSALEDLGVVNEDIVAFQALAQNTDALKESGLDLANSSYAQIEAFAQEKLSAEDTAQGIAVLLYQQMLVANNPLDTLASIQALANLGGKAAETAGILAELAQIMAQISNLQTWMANNPNADASLVEATLSGLQKRAESLKTKVTVDADADVDYGDATKSAGSAGSEAGDQYVSQFEKSLEELQTLRDQGKISEKEYLDALRSLYKKFFGDKKKYAEQYAKYERQYLEGRRTCPLLQ